MNSYNKKDRTEIEQEILSNLGECLKLARIKKDLSQEDVAHLAGFSRSYYTEIENGKRNVSFLNLIKLIETLDISLSDILIIGNT